MTADARAAISQKVYDNLMTNYDATKWAEITPYQSSKQCDITKLQMGIFSVNLDDLDDLATACASEEGCTFDKDAYVPYALGFLMTQGDWKCGVSPGKRQTPFIVKSETSVANLPFEVLYWSWFSPAVNKLYESFSVLGGYIYFDGARGCSGHDFTNGCFSY